MKKLSFLLIVTLLFLSSCKKDYAVERTIIIAAPQDLVWQQVKYFNNWQSWSPWYAKDSTMTWTFTGTDGEVESAYAWTSENSGSGSMTNIGTTEGEELKYHTHFLKPWESESDGYIRLKTVENGTEVSWGFTGHMKGIAALFMNMDKMVGPDFEDGLKRLKSNIEALSKEQVALQVKEIDFKGQDYIAVREFIDISGIEPFFATNFSKIMETGIEMQGGFPSGLYYLWDVEAMQTDIAAAIPVAAGTAVPEGFTSIKIPAGKALMIEYYGPYSGSGKAHELLETYMVEHELEYLGPAIEEYVSDPMEDPDPSKWLTKVMYPVK